MSADKRIADKLNNLIYDIERLDIWLDNPASDMTLGEYEDKCKEIIESCAKSIEEMLDAGTCHAVLDEGYYRGINGVCEGLYCSKCKGPLSHRFKHCPECGARIKEEAG